MLGEYSIMSSFIWIACPEEIIQGMCMASESSS
jgi:hypothetical protein